jgi:hypothetical protein
VPISYMCQEKAEKRLDVMALATGTSTGSHWPTGWYCLPIGKLPKTLSAAALKLAWLRGGLLIIGG